jgi:hypothetical protein
MPTVARERFRVVSEEEFFRGDALAWTGCAERAQGTKRTTGRVVALAAIVAAAGVVGVMLAAQLTALHTHRSRRLPAQSSVRTWAQVNARARLSDMTGGRPPTTPARRSRPPVPLERSRPRPATLATDAKHVPSRVAVDRPNVRRVPPAVAVRRASNRALGGAPRPAATRALPRAAMTTIVAARPATRVVEFGFER